MHIVQFKYNYNNELTCERSQKATIGDSYGLIHGVTIRDYRQRTGKLLIGLPLGGMLMVRLEIFFIYFVSSI